MRLFTHTDLDGIGCAILAKYAFGSTNADITFCDYDDVDAKIIHAMVHEILPMRLFKNFEKIHITDISINEKAAEMLDNRYEKNLSNVQLLDHHPTALWLNKYDWCIVEENNDWGLKTSGTELYYNFLADHQFISKTRQLNDFVQIVTNYDTWRWSTFGDEGLISKHLNDLLYIYGRDQFIAWCLDKLNNHNFITLDDNDRLVLGMRQQEIDRYVDAKDKQLITITKYGKTFGVIFAERYISELGNRLCANHPEIDFIAMIDISSGVISYRTVKDDIHLGNDIAKPLGGGGHAKAAGSRFSAEELFKIVIDHIFKDNILV